MVVRLVQDLDLDLEQELDPAHSRVSAASLEAEARRLPIRRLTCQAVVSHRQTL
jgi:hypothetical protein